MHVSFPESLLGLWLHLTLRSGLGPPFPFRVQRHYMALQNKLVLLEGSVSRRATELAGVPATLFTPRGQGAVRATRAPVVLYAHGAAFVGGSSRTHASLTGFLARYTGGPVYSVDYRLAPEHPYPAGRHDLLQAWTALVERFGAENVVVGGDSAGGAMVLDLLLDLRARGGRQPAGALLFSPEVGLSMPRPRGADRWDTILRRGWIYTGLAALARPDTPEHRILGQDLSGLAPIYLQYSRREYFEAECAQLARELAQAGSPPVVRYDALTWGWHVLALLPGLSAQARDSLQQAAQFVRAAVAGGNRIR